MAAEAMRRYSKESWKGLESVSRRSKRPCSDAERQRFLDAAREAAKQKRALQRQAEEQRLHEEAQAQEAEMETEAARLIALDMKEEEAAFEADEAMLRFWHTLHFDAAPCIPYNVLLVSQARTDFRALHRERCTTKLPQRAPAHTSRWAHKLLHLQGFWGFSASSRKRAVSHHVRLVKLTTDVKSTIARPDSQDSQSIDMGASSNTARRHTPTMCAHTMNLDFALGAQVAPERTSRACIGLDMNHTRAENEHEPRARVRRMYTLMHRTILKICIQNPDVKSMSRRPTDQKFQQ